jgi:glutamine synthetase
MCAITNPTVNSYKRLNAPVTTSGATWSPNTISYSGNNRSHMIRIPEAGRFELRLPDGATNPYLAQSAVIAAGLDGIRNKRDPGKRLDINMYTEGHKLKSVKSLPLNLLDATRSFEKSVVFASAFGDEFMSAYAKQKYAEWNGFSRHLTDWERTQTLDC